MRPSLLAQQGMADEPEADRGENRSSETARDRVQHLCAKHHAEDRPQCQQESAAADCGHGDCREQAFGGDVIDQRADRNLQRHGGERPDRQDQPDVQLRPTLRRQIGGDKRSPSGLDVGEEECKPVEPALAPTRGLVLFVLKGNGAVHFPLGTFRSSSMPFITMRPLSISTLRSENSKRRSCSAHHISQLPGRRPSWQAALYRIGARSIGDAPRGIRRQARAHPRLEQLDIAGSHRGDGRADTAAEQVDRPEFVEIGERPLHRDLPRLDRFEARTRPQLPQRFHPGRVGARRVAAA